MSVKCDNESAAKNLFPFLEMKLFESFPILNR